VLNVLDHWQGHLQQYRPSCKSRHQFTCPFDGPEFQSTRPSELMDKVIADMEQQGLIRQASIKNAFLCFLIAKMDRSARFVKGVSSCTPRYTLLCVRRLSPYFYCASRLNDQVRADRLFPASDQNISSIALRYLPRW
jgi:hypothetical protein